MGRGAGGGRCTYFQLIIRLRTGEPANAGAHLVAVTADGLVVLARRSADVAVNPGTWGFPAESADPDLDASGLGPWDPVAAARRASVEELGCPLADDDPPGVVAVHLGRRGANVYVAARLACSAAELAARAAGAPDAWERAELRCVDPHDPTSWPTLAGAKRAACHAAVRRLGT